MKQIRTALAVASLLNRTLLVTVLVGCDAPIVVQVNVMLKDLPADIYGPGIDIREYSFLENPLLPKRIKESLLEVQLCDKRFPNCHITNKTSQSQILRFPKHSSEEMFTTIFSSFKDVKVIRFSSMEDAFQGFTDKASCLAVLTVCAFLSILSAEDILLCPNGLTESGKRGKGFGVAWWTMFPATYTMTYTGMRNLVGSPFCRQHPKRIVDLNRCMLLAHLREAQRYPEDSVQTPGAALRILSNVFSNSRARFTAKNSQMQQLLQKAKSQCGAFNEGCIKS
ncbi:hypothetical protein ACLOJK_012357 [Asimina triloba]